MRMPASTRDNFCFKVLIEPAVGNQRISQHPQLGLESAPDRKHVQRTLTLHQINRIIPFAIAGCELASEFQVGQVSMSRTWEEPYRTARPASSCKACRATALVTAFAPSMVVTVTTPSFSSGKPTTSVAKP